MKTRAKELACLMVLFLGFSAQTEPASNQTPLLREEDKYAAIKRELKEELNPWEQKNLDDLFTEYRHNENMQSSKVFDLKDWGIRNFRVHFDCVVWSRPDVAGFANIYIYPDKKEWMYCKTETTDINDIKCPGNYDYAPLKTLGGVRIKLNKVVLLKDAEERYLAIKPTGIDVFDENGIIAFSARDDEFQAEKKLSSGEKMINFEWKFWYWFVRPMPEQPQNKPVIIPPALIIPPK